METTKTWTQTPLEDHRKWREDLILHLRLEDVPGDRIGDILMEVDTHIRDTGETPEEAFGPAKAYARSRGGIEPEVDDDDGMDPTLLIIAISAFAGTYLLTSGAIGTGKGADSVLLLPPAVALSIGAVILAVLVMRLPVDLIRHPVSKRPLFGDSHRWRGIVLAILAIIAVGFFLIGRVLA